jgi:CheY-like chemotaxis protein
VKENLIMKVLIADDDKQLCQLLSTVLRGKGCEVVLAFDSMQVVMQAIRNSPDVIVLDIVMPGGTGIEALKNLKANSKTTAIPVLAISAKTDPRLAKQAKDLGAAEFMRKPLNTEELYPALCKLVGVP